MQDVIFFVIETRIDKWLVDIISQFIFVTYFLSHKYGVKNFRIIFIKNNQNRSYNNIWPYFVVITKKLFVDLL